MTFAVRVDRTAHPTIGIEGGRFGAPSRVEVNGKAVHPKKTIELVKGDVYTVQCAGGAGYGDPAERDGQALARDVADGYVSPEAARRDYGRRG